MFKKKNNEEEIDQLPEKDKNFNVLYGSFKHLKEILEEWPNDIIYILIRLGKTLKIMYLVKFMLHLEYQLNEFGTIQLESL